jgi:crossover junction endodeoxyribonuclease RusA
VTAVTGRPGHALTFTVLGKPAPQGSKRYIGRGRMIESSMAAGPWRDKIAAETRRAWGYADPLAGPVAVAVEFFFARPAAHFGTGRNRAVLKPGSPPWPIGRTGDVDKLVRAVLDGITIGRAIADDAQVVELAASKHYSETPRCTITIREM